MFDYGAQISEFLKLNFSPSNPEESNFKVTSTELLGYLFQIFPDDCINDYDLNEILITLGYQRFSYAVETITITEGKQGNTIEKKRYDLVFGWCLFTDKIPITTEKK